MAGRLPLTSSVANLRAERFNNRASSFEISDIVIDSGDADNDGVIDSVDACPNTLLGEVVNEVGCSLSQLDSDSDGVSDAVDQCPATQQGDAVNEQGCAL